MLAATNRDGIGEFFWAAIGIAGGLLISVIRLLYGAFAADPAVPLDLVDTVEVMLFSGALVGALVAGFVTRKRGNAAASLVQQIKNQSAGNSSGPNQTVSAASTSNADK